MVIGGCGVPVARSAATAASASAIPAFMSNVPGPWSRSPSRWSGIRSSVPIGQTVSKWPSSSTGRPVAGDAGPKVVAALRLRQHLDLRADLPKHPGEHGAAAIDRRLVGARGLEPDQRLDRRDRFGRVRFAVFQQLFHGHP